MKREGKIKVHSENMFPIIKKWLYSNKDIFIREIISNSCDAIKKLEKLIDIGEAQIGNYLPGIDVFIDKEKQTISVSDNGLGMTEDEVEKYISQIAFSGAEEFLNKYKDKLDSGAETIGHFGLGFYSAYMVSNLVEIDTLSYKPGAKPIHWESDGSSTYTISEGSKDSVGTTITLHINSNEEEFLNKEHLYDIIKKYCYFMPYEIYIESDDDIKKELSNEQTTEQPKPINNTHPLWLKLPKDCTNEEYENFYRETFMDPLPPLFWIHLNVDYPFNLKGILYFPKQKNTLDINKGQVKLFCNQVYIADNIQEVIPEFLMLLKGTIDCSDLPLNVSRSSLQNDGDVRKISNHITKKVADKLISIFNNDRAQFESYWDDISPFIEYGCMNNEKFYDKVKNIILHKTINNEYLTLNEFIEKNGKEIFYVTDIDSQSQYIKLFKENNLDALILSSIIDNHFIDFLEYNIKDIRLKRIDSDISNSLKGNNELSNSKDILDRFKSFVNVENLLVEIQPLKTSQLPAMILLSEEEIRLKEAKLLYGDIFPEIEQPITTKIVLNSESDIIRAIPNLPDDKCKILCNNIYNMAMISHKPLSSDELTEFINQNTELLKVFVHQ